VLESSKNGKPIVTTNNFNIVGTGKELGSGFQPVVGKKGESQNAQAMPIATVATPKSMK
jgi:hypothetical protein